MKQTQELNSSITSEDYLATTFKWSHIINQYLKAMSWEIQQDKELMAEFEEQSQVFQFQSEQRLKLWR